MGELPLHPMIFFQKAPIKTNAPHGAPPPPARKNEAPTENQPPPLLKSETPFQEMIPRKKTQKIRNCH